MDSGRLETVPQGPVHLDTVRALHQTVVSLRNALEVSKNELKELKNKYEQHSQCNNYAHIIEKLTLENTVLRRKIIDSGALDGNESNASSQNIKFEVSYSPIEVSNADAEESKSDIVIETTTPEVNVESDLIESFEQDSVHSKQQDLFCSTEQLNNTFEEDVNESLNRSDSDQSPCNDPCSQVSVTKEESKPSKHRPSFKTKLELLSKFDVRIKVRTLNDGTVASSTTSETESTVEDKDQENTDRQSREPEHIVFEHKEEHFDETEDIKKHIQVKTFSSENIKMAVPSEADVKNKNDTFDVQVRITSEENLVVKDVTDRPRRKDTLNLDVDDLSLRSLSEGDNSVFSETGVTALDSAGADLGHDERHFDQENASGNESEEVDDIELIFTTDESKDMSNLQEDLVSIRESEWEPSATSTTQSTPVLIKFHTLDPDFQPRAETGDNVDNENQENSNLQSVIAESTVKAREKRVSLPNDKEIKHVGFNAKSLDLPGRPGILKSYDNKTENVFLYKKSPNTSTRRLDSVDSLSCEYMRGLSFDNTKSSSFELGSSMDILNREESIDNFHRNAHLGHRFSVFAERDMSKCGISEDDLASVNLNIRRNTCPNPFQYRPLSTRGYVRPPASGPFKAPAARARPILRDSYSVRRENGAQTDVSALPNRWSSDGYLAHKIGPPPAPARAPAPRRPAPPAPAPARRVLLSDIGFTSMVPELSRSADPVWAASGRPPAPACAVCACAATAAANATAAAKYLPRGPSFRSPCPSIDRSHDWIPHSAVTFKEQRMWRSSLPDVRRDDTDELLDEAEVFLRRSIDNLRITSTEYEGDTYNMSRPYIPAEPRHLRLGHTVKLITPQGRIAVGRVRYVGLAGARAADCGVVVGAILPRGACPWLPLNDGTHRGRRYFLAPAHHAALFVPFSKVVMAWAN